MDIYEAECNDRKNDKKELPIETRLAFSRKIFCRARSQKRHAHISLVSLPRFHKGFSHEVSTEPWHFLGEALEEEIMPTKIVLIAGTNRPGSQTLRVTKMLEKKYQAAGAETLLLDLNKLPMELFEPSAYEKKPASFAPFSEGVLNADGLLVVTPEYNGSFPGVLKLFIDHLKFPESFEGRPVAFLGLAAGMWGALRSVEQLQMIFSYRNARLFNERVFLPRVESQLNPDASPKDSVVGSLIDSQVKNFIKFVEALKPIS